MSDSFRFVPRTRRGSALLWVFLALGVVVVVAIIAWAMSRMPSPDSERRARANASGGDGGREIVGAAFDAPTPAGSAVRVRLAVGDVVVERALSRPDFALTAGQSLDARVPAGPFDATMLVPIRNDAGTNAKIGAEVRNGLLRVERDGRVVLSIDAADEPVRVMSETLLLSPGRNDTTWRFRRVGDGPSRLRTLWQPTTAVAPAPLPVVHGTPLAEAGVHGLQLVRDNGCAACHRPSDATLATWLDAPAGPDLAAIGRRASPGWLRSWIRDPHAIKANARMPRLFHGGDLDEETVEELVHFLVAQGGGAGREVDPFSQPADPDLIATGRTLYHEVGCFACHGPLATLAELPGRAAEAIGSRAGEPNGVPPRVELGAVGEKWSLDALTAYLKEPHATRSEGLMPSLELTDLEARSLASYVRHEFAPSGSRERFEWDSAHAAAGVERFRDLGCVGCHEAGVDEVLEFEASSFESIVRAVRNGAPTDSCIGDSPMTAGVARFDFDQRELESVRAFVSSLDTLPACVDVPIDEATITLDSLNCLACHEHAGRGGPDLSIDAFFATTMETDLGDEGRLPPSLDDVGARLNQTWLSEVLEAHGRARPYMAARMPVYATEQVDRLAEQFASFAGIEPSETVSLAVEEPEFSEELATQGRHLVGVGGFNCIQCHGIGGQPSTGSPGPDLGGTVGRLRYDRFHRWLLDPKSLRPGTRMPSFWVNGKSGATDILGGDADRQIAAIWAYLSQGEFLPLPDGINTGGSLDLVVQERPVVFRTFMQGVGARAIAVGFPEQVHVAFDAERCRLALAWEGAFLDASGAWANRGGAETNPEDVAWSSPPTRPLRVGGATGDARFRGYELDEAGAPAFRYDIDFEGTVVRVRESPRVVRDESGRRVVRSFAFEGPAGLAIRVEGRDEPVVLGDDGLGSCELEVRW